MKKEKIVAIPAALLMTALLAFPAMASEKIEEVTIDINAVLTDSDDVYKRQIMIRAALAEDEENN